MRSDEPFVSEGRCTKAKAVQRIPMLIAAMVSVPASGENLFNPIMRVNPDDYTVLMSLDAKLIGALFPQEGDRRKFDVTDWTRLDQSFTWDVTVPEAGDYAISLVIRHNGGRPVKSEVTCGENKTAHVFEVRSTKICCLMLLEIGWSSTHLPKASKPSIFHGIDYRPASTFETEFVRVAKLDPCSDVKQLSDGRKARLARLTPKTECVLRPLPFRACRLPQDL